MLLRDAGQESRHVHERDEWNVERVAGPDESRGLDGRVDVERAREHGRLLRHHADRSSAEPRKPDDDVCRPRRLDLEELAVVDDAPQDVVHVIRLRRLVGHDGIELRVHAIARVARLPRRRIGEVVLRQVSEQSPNGIHRLGLVACREMRHAAASGMDAGAAERLRVDDLVRHRAHDVRPGDEHVARPLDHDREVRHRGRIDRAAGARPEDHRDLRHDARTP